MSKVKKSIFNARDNIADVKKTLISHCPSGRAWNLTDDAANCIVEACATNFQTIEELIETFVREFDINQTFDFIEEWEESVGIPDSCLLQVGTIEGRRKQVIQRLRKQPIVTLQEMQALVDELFPDDNITLYNGTEYFSYEYQYEHTFLGAINERFIIVAEVPFQNEYEYDYEYTYSGGPDVDKLRCVLEQIIPADDYLHIEFISSTEA